MNQFWEFVPIVIFAVTFFATDIFTATAALMIAIGVQVGVYYLLKKPISNQLKLTFWVSMTMGGLTLYFRNEAFLLWKPTIIYWLLSAALIFGNLTKNNLLKKGFGSQLKAPDNIWTQLSYGWAVGLLFIGFLNLYVAFNFSLEFWVKFKLMGIFALTLLYSVATFVFLSKKGYLKQLEEAQAKNNPPHNNQSSSEQIND